MRLWYRRRWSTNMDAIIRKTTIATRMVVVLMMLLQMNIRMRIDNRRPLLNTCIVQAHEPFLPTSTLRTRSKASITRVKMAFASQHLPSTSQPPSTSHRRNNNYYGAFTKRVPIAARRQNVVQLQMVFDFFRDRTKEGLDQLQNLGQKVATGQLGQGLQDVASYTQQTNQAFAIGLTKSRNRFVSNLEALFTGTSTNIEDMLDELQDILLQADLGTITAEEIVQEVKSLQEESMTRLSKEDLKSIMRGKLIEALDVGPTSAIQFQPSNENGDSIDDNESSTSSSTTSRNGKLHIPTVLFIMGANGMGKTTTIGKLAHRLRTEGNQTVVLAACDTFRAGAVEQLQMWANRANVTMIGPSREGMKPSAVLFDALSQGIADKVDTVIVDTSGRLSNNDALTQELAKMKRVIQTRLSLEIDPETNKPIPNVNVPHETLLVIDAAQGRMALDSAKVWDESIGLTGLILTKLDGSARGGSVVAVSRDLGLPVKLIGVGEGIDDLRDVRSPLRSFFVKLFDTGHFDISISTVYNLSLSILLEQFDAAIFVDGLLGIGVAGGNSATSFNEGDILASRLAELRQERDLRSKIKEQNPPMVTTTMETKASTTTRVSQPSQKPSRPGKKKGKK
jgi:fused signal recognition particle receptor